MDLRHPCRADPAAAFRPGPARGSRIASCHLYWRHIRGAISDRILRWVFVVPHLAEAYVSGGAAARTAVDAAWTAQHQFGGALLGEHLGQLLVIGWTIALSTVILRSRILPRWLGAAGLVTSVLYLLNQGDILATAVPGFPVWDLAGLIGSSTWGLWVAALGAVLLLKRTTPPAPIQQ